VRARVLLPFVSLLPLACAHAPVAMPPPALKPEETALVLIEFQNEWLREDQHLHGLISRYLKRFDTVEHAKQLRSELRSRGVLILHAPLIYSPGYAELPQPRGLQKNIVEKGLFLEGSASAEIHQDFRPAPGEVVVHGRKGLSAFSGSDLEELLRQRGIKNVILAGFATNVCVSYTGADAFDRGYRVILAKDAVATFDQPSLLTFLGISVLGQIGEQLHEGALGEALDNEQLISRLTPTAAQATESRTLTRSR
jgi:ureidoacrylate peracid hydrolase